MNKLTKYISIKLKEAMSFNQKERKSRVNNRSSVVSRTKSKRYYLCLTFSRNFNPKTPLKKLSSSRTQFLRIIRERVQTKKFNNLNQGKGIISIRTPFTKRKTKKSFTMANFTTTKTNSNQPQLRPFSPEGFQGIYL